MDEALGESFPASDPPAWNPGMARPIPPDTSRDHADDIRLNASRDEIASGSPGVIDVSRRFASERTRLQALISLAGVAGIALLVPFAILLVGLPIALAARGLLEVLVWFFPTLG